MRGDQADGCSGAMKSFHDTTRSTRSRSTAKPGKRSNGAPISGAGPLSDTMTTRRCTLGPKWPESMPAAMVIAVSNVEQ